MRPLAPGAAFVGALALALSAPLARADDTRPPPGRVSAAPLSALAPKAPAASARTPAMSSPAPADGAARSDAGAGAADNEGSPVGLDALALRAEKGDAASQYRLGMHLLYGTGRADDGAAGRAWLHRAAAQNHAAAHYQLGLIYLTGDGVEPDIAEAHAHLRLAARHGDPRARAMVFYVGQRMNQAEHGRAASRAREIGDGKAAR
jgi:TPR repeat protein